MKRRAPKQERKTIILCRRCGKKQTVLATNAKFIILCPRCGAGMREYSVRERPTE